MVNFKNLLPSVLRTTKWGDLASVVQSMDFSLRDAVYRPIYNRFTYDHASKEELISTGKMLGWDIVSFPNTYTDTLHFIRNEVSTITKRILCKNSKKAYKYTSYAFGMDDEVYPMMYNSSGYLLGKLNTMYNIDAQVSHATLVTDQEGDNLYYNAPVIDWNLDGTKFLMDDNTALDFTIAIYGDPRSTGLEEVFTDTDAALETDAIATSKNTGQITTSFTRNITYAYHHKYLESSSEWLSGYSLLSLQNDIDQIHKATERVYYEPWLQISPSVISGETSTQVYYNYDRSISGTINSISTGGSLLDAQYVHFGTGSQCNTSGIIPSNITGVAEFSYCIPSGVISGLVDSTIPFGVAGWSFYEQPSSTYLNFDFILSEFNKFTPFTELSILDSSSGLICYASFPKVQWTSSMYNNIRVQINLV